MAPTTRKNEHDVPQAEGGRQAALEAEIAEMRAEIFALRSRDQGQPSSSTETKPRVPTGIPKFKGKCDEDVRRWIFHVETLCRIHGHDASNDNTTLPAIAGTAMDEPASVWLLLCASRTSADEQSWGRFTNDAFTHFETSNHQAVLRQKLRQLHQFGDIEEYNGKYSSLTFRVENMSEVDQVSYYCDGLKPASQAYVKLRNPTTLSEAMDQAVKLEESHCGGYHFGYTFEANREISILDRPLRDQLLRAQALRDQPSRNPTIGTYNKKVFHKRSYKP
ncbi:hypothetical protein PHMEG_0003104 [Phytophthora megakarya]|uniref:Ty3 transposon capsid-like protein domain-containing protein n=1 Tax=Phytophthora megakarya TaxID=4795 RepID=A0A225WWT9_9STRA|nr:hypothetical protein PHMEG_0003104 [Phytophthora megakarya]